MVVALVGVTMGILYCRRKEYTGHRPTLMDDVDAQDDYRLWVGQSQVESVVIHDGLNGVMNSHVDSVTP